MIGRLVTVFVPVVRETDGELYGAWEAVMGDPTEVPGLSVTPDVNADGYTGRWRITHTNSGLPLGEPFADAPAAAASAILIKDVPGANWRAQRAVPADSEGRVLAEVAERLGQAA